jgi:Tfp pilus assembly protein PilN
MNEGTQVYAPPTNGTGQQEFGWRNVPKINLLPERRSYRLSPVIVLLVVVLIAEAVAAQVLYGQLRAEELAVIDANHTLNQAQQALSAEQSATDREALTVVVLDQQIAEIEAQDAVILDAYTQLAQPRPEWAATLQALLQADNADFLLNKLTADPSGTIELSATATGPDGIREFLTHMASVSDILSLADWDSEQGDTALKVDAVVELK